MTQFQRQLIQALRSGADLVPVESGEIWALARTPGKYLTDPHGQPLTVCSRTLKRWGWWPAWTARAMAIEPEPISSFASPPPHAALVATH